MKIQDLETLTGLDRATIRYYETEGMFRPNRLENGYRDYSDDDKTLLIRIKLLRQIGIPLVKIKELQQGSAVLSDTLSKQIEKLHMQRDSTQRSVQLCELLLSDNVAFEDLDGALYLSRLETMPIEYPRQPEEANEYIPEFHEQLQPPWHPFRHLIGRTADIFLVQLVLTLIWIYALHLRVSDSWLFFLPPIFLAPLVLVPLEAVCYRLFGTTLGKYAMGIQVTRNDGRKHSLSTGIRRSFRAYRYGWAYGIPIMHLWAIADGWDNHKLGKIKWNDESEITYHPCHKRRLVTGFTVLILITLLGTVTNYALHLPKYAWKDLTLSELSANYNYYASQNHLKINKMNSDGSIFIPDYLGYNALREVDYIMDSGTVKGFSYGYVDAEFIRVAAIPEEFRIAMYALIVARPGHNKASLNDFYVNFRKVITAAIKDGTNYVDFIYENIKVQWSIDYKNCTYYPSSKSTGFLRANRDGSYKIDSSVNILFHLELID
ncbi:MAG: MerR family transcriptional regulator [Ruminococcaceae bacterium]|nr:MerR family transcriptional regulator [Oscillospiraceae bacterium]